jgi:hypothetical protein
MSFESTHDARVVLVREKYFSLRPKPLERWLWQQAIAPSAERVFWIHWEEGHRNGTWCSEIPIKRVALECYLDVSTVTRAYQQLTSLGLIRRQDPGRDPRNPFQQATAITEVRLPRELATNLRRFPTRRQSKAVSGRAQAEPAQAPPPQPVNTDSRPRLSIKEGLRRLKVLEQKMSPREAAAFTEAQRTHGAYMEFDQDTGLSAAERAEALDWLSKMAGRPTCGASVASADSPSRTSESTDALPRKPTVFEAARAKRDLEKIVGVTPAQDLLRQIFWAMEKGALRRFAPPHAINIAIKKVREGLWTRPHRMPPNWAIPLLQPAHHERCRTA